MELIKADISMTTQVLKYMLDEDTEIDLGFSAMCDIENKIKAALGEVYPFVRLVESANSFFKFYIEGSGQTQMSRRHVAEAFTWLQIHISKEYPDLIFQGEG